MPRTSQIVPEHLYPHQMVVVNDNTTYLNTPATDSGNTRMLFVFASPKGRDGKIQTIDTGLGGFLDEYGLGPFSLYGQPLLNAYSAAASGTAILHCLRVTAPDATYASMHIVAKYKVEDEKVTVKFVAEPSETPLTDLSLLGESYTPSTEVDADGFSSALVLSFAYLGKGSYGDNIRVRISSYTAADKENGYKNYIFEVYVNDGGLVKKEDFSVIFNENATISGVSKFSDAVVNDPQSGSNLVSMVTHSDGFKKLFDIYTESNPETVLSENDFDALLGINKYSKEAIENYTIDNISEDAVSLNGLGGMPLVDGDDGALGADKTDAVRVAALEEAYLAAYGGQTDVAIKSKNKYPTNIILDANFSVPVKQLIAALAIARTDCVAILDCGIGITTKQSILPYLKTNLDTYVTNRVQSIDAYAFKVKDPYSSKIVTVTSTYWLSAAYPVNFNNNGAKHVPLAGNNFGILSGYIPNSVYPIFDEDIDSAIMDELTDNNVNYARINANQDVVRGTQDTRQLINSNLSELNNVFILLDIKRDCERMCTEFEFNFSEPEDIARFNAIARDLLGQYQDAQVRSIAARFDKNDWEAERGILHLYVEFVNKDLVKTTIIEIDVNRS